MADAVEGSAADAGPTVNANQIALVQDSFRLVAPIADTAAELFYARLFELDPSLRDLFPSDLREQRRKLMQTLTVAVRGLSNLESLAPVVRALGRRHVGYGVQPEHFDTVGTALLWTLAAGLGPDFTDEVRDAWAAVYGLLGSVMRDGMADAQLPLAA
jgi:hemoglobin-like flavoprotein